MSDKNPYEEISEVDLAYKILTDSGKDNPLHFKALILEILDKKNKSVQNEAVAISELIWTAAFNTSAKANGVLSNGIRPKQNAVAAA